jgi:glutamyl-tRNA synthetase
MRDPMLRQRNGSPAYQLASLADDVDHNINLIVRGEDLLPSTSCQLYVARLLGLRSFQQARFIHHPLITNANGAKLSKSEGASSLKAMSAAGLSRDDLHTRADAMLAELMAQGL